MSGNFVKYVLSFYGEGGVYEMRNAEGKTPTAQLVRSLLPAMHDAMHKQGWNWCDGDSMDREFFREEVLAPAGYTEYITEGESK